LQPKSIRLGPGSADAEIRFGYAENGDIDEFYCTKRAEACVSKATYAVATPFNFITVDGHDETSCTSGCTIQIPAIAGRILWWQEFRSTDSGTTWSARGTVAPMTK
jgi:hypothetical protein